MATRIKSIEDTVRKLLADHPHLRDDDNKLVANVWYMELVKKGRNPQALSANQFMEEYANGSLTNSDSVTRSRRQLQEKNPELRGKTWKERQKYQSTVKEDLGYGKPMAGNGGYTP